MSRDTPQHAFAVVTSVVVICATLVSAAVVLLRPVQLDNRLLEHAHNVLQLTSLSGGLTQLDDAVVLERFRALDARVVNLETGRFETGIDPYAFDARQAVADPQRNRAIPADDDLAGLGRQARYAVVYLDWGPGGLQRMILPVHGMGMWSTIYGFIALESDLNTIAAATFYEQAETPGVGDRITRADWLQKWRGRLIYDDEGVARFAVAPGEVAPGSATALHQVDGLSGATVTADAVTAMLRFWFGPWGYQSLLEGLRAQVPHPPAAQSVGAP